MGPARVSASPRDRRARRDESRCSRETPRLARASELWASESWASEFWTSESWASESLAAVLLVAALAAGCGSSAARGDAPLAEPARSAESPAAVSAIAAPEEPGAATTLEEPSEPSAPSLPSPEPLPEGTLALPAPGAQLALGGAFSCAVDAAGQVWCWGSNRFGQLGDPELPRGTAGKSVRPRRVEVSARRLAAGTFHVCALDEEGGVRCWGHGGFGQLGRGERRDAAAPAPVLTAPGVPLREVVAVAAGREFSCALRRDGRVLCWGGNDRMQLGLHEPAPTEPTPTEPTPTDAVQASPAAAGSASARGGRWAVRTLGRADDEDDADEGDEDTAEDTTEATENAPPVRVLFATEVPDLSDAIALAAGRAHACVVVRDGRVRCWGEGLEGQTGALRAGSGATDVEVPGRRRRPGTPLRLEHTSAEALGELVTPLEDVLSLGGGHSCVRDGAELRCWGRNASLELGPGPRGARRFEPRVAPAALAQVAAGGSHTCVRTEGGGVHCVGAGRSGQIGDGRRRRARRFVPVELGGVARTIASGVQHSCAWMAAGGVRCWGAGKRGQLGPASVATDEESGETNAPTDAASPLTLHLPGHEPREGSASSAPR